MGKLPKRWQEATAFQLDKRNGKPGCPGIRLINLLCPMGKAVFKHLWRRLGDLRKVWAYGCDRHKCREMAIGVVMAVRWRLKAAGKGTVATFRDVANAFPSMSRNALDGMLARKAQEKGMSESHARLLGARYGCGTMRVSSPGQEVPSQAR